MNWYEGNIAEAVNLSKTKNSIFVVYVEGPDDLSKKITNLINHDNIRKYLESNYFVAIKIQSGSEAYMQFAQIYQLVPLPSLFFIGRNGTPLQIVTGVTNTVEEMEEKIESVLTSTGIEVRKLDLEKSSSSQKLNAKLTASESAQSASGSSAPQVTENSETSKNAEASFDGDVCVTEEPDDEIEQQKLLDEKLKRAKELVEKQRKEKEAQEKEAEKERELKRRCEGQKLLDLKKSQEDQELKQLKEDRKREKQQEQEARRRILLQIEQDRLERAQRFGQTVPTTQTPTTENPPKPATSRTNVDSSNNNLARIQFKKPGGDIEMHTFESSDMFSVVRAHVMDNIVPSVGIRDFKLATTFPRREFTSADNETTLKDLGLSPTSVLLILPVTRSSSGPGVVSTTSRGVFDMAYSIIWNLFTPFIAVYGYVKNLIFNRPPPRENTGAEKRANEDRVSDNDAAKRRNMRIFETQQPSTSGASSSSPREENKGAYRRVGGSNIHRLHESRDSDDENNTWNGNSTQQQ